MWLLKWRKQQVWVVSSHAFSATRPVSVSRHVSFFGSHVSPETSAFKLVLFRLNVAHVHLVLHARCDISCSKHAAAGGGGDDVQDERTAHT